MGSHVRCNNQERCSWLLIAVATMALFLMPVDYRAGANRPHPHAMLQLIYEASRGIPLHHHAIGYAQSSPQRSAGDHAAMAGGDANTQSLTAGQNAPMSDIAEQRDGIFAAVTLSLFAITIAFSSITAIPVRRPDKQVFAVPTLCGIVLSPDPPPPQRAAYQIAVW